MPTRPVLPSDRRRLVEMRAQLWPDGSPDEHARDVDEILAGQFGVYPYVIFVAEDEAGEVIGFADVTLRSYADGCDPARPVGYLEGWFVDERHRRRRVGAALVRAAEDWARGQGCTEFASDTWLEAVGSQKAHEALGFEVVDRVVNYRKRL